MPAGLPQRVTGFGVAAKQGSSERRDKAMNKPSVRNSLTRSMKRLLRDQLGNMAAAVAVVALPLMMAGGAAVDYSN